MRVWDNLISKHDREVYKAAGYGKTTGLTQANARPAVLVIDVTVNFIGDKSEPILESIKRYPNSCGKAGWEATHRIAELLPVARRAKAPVFYSVTDSSPDGKPDMSWDRKKFKNSTEEGNRVPAVISPRPGDAVVPKKKPSVFFGTPLISYLTSMRRDTLLVTGCTTSGCVRATVLDAFSYGFKVAVVEECVFDRGEVSHKVNLFDMSQKYADVIPLKDATRYLRAVRAGN